MKKLSILFLLILASCNEQDFSTTYTFYNSTDFELNIQADEELSFGTNDFSYLIGANETISFTLEDFGGLFIFVPLETTERVFASKFNINQDFSYRIIDYDYQIKYLVSGTADSALITYSTSSGGIGQTTRALPYAISYKNFGDDWVSLSAQGEDGNGFVTVEIFVEDDLKYSGQAGGFGVATASGSWINLYN